MSRGYSLCDSSQALLQRCIAASSPRDENSKWVQKFGHLLQNGGNVNTLTNENCLETTDKQEKSLLEDINQENHNKIENSESQPREELFEVLEADPISNFDNMVKETLKDKDFLTEMTKKLSTSAVEKIFNYIFTNNNINSSFIQCFYQNFLPVYFEKEYSWFSLDLIDKAYKYNREEFDKLILLLFKNTKIPSKLLEEFFPTLSEKEKGILFSKIAEAEFTLEEFVHHLQLIFTAYKEVKNDTKMQEFIYRNILLYGPSCSTEKTFGRLLLLFLQNQNNLGLLKDAEKFESLIESHCTPFKKPCLNSYRENLTKYNSV